MTAPGLAGEALQNQVRRKPQAWDLQLTLMASRLDRLLGQRAGNGYETTKSRHLFRDLVAAAEVTIAEQEVEVRFQTGAHNPSLPAASFARK